MCSVKIPFPTSSVRARPLKLDVVLFQGLRHGFRFVDQHERAWDLLLHLQQASASICYLLATSNLICLSADLLRPERVLTGARSVVRPLLAPRYRVEGRNSLVVQSKCSCGLGSFLQMLYKLRNFIPVLVGSMNFDHEQLDVEPSLLFTIRQAIEMLQPTLSQPVRFLMRKD